MSAVTLSYTSFKLVLLYGIFCNPREIWAEYSKDVYLEFHQTFFRIIIKIVGEHFESRL